MQVFKFGGTSVGSARNIKKVAKIVTADGKPKVVVLSAMAGTTDMLVSVSDLVASGAVREAREQISLLRQKYMREIKDLYTRTRFLEKAKDHVSGLFNRLEDLIRPPISNNIRNEILSFGELLSTQMFYLYLQEKQVHTRLISALDLVRLEASGEPDMEYIRMRSGELLNPQTESEIMITQGFICLNSDGIIDNLKRGGSDYTASLIGAAINAEAINIYTDISGMHNNDPRFVENTFPVEEISFDEAAELAYFGAKILHPQSILPAKEHNIPVWLKNTFEPEAHGTLIHNKLPENGKISALAAKSGITAIKIKSYRMLLAYGFLKQIFDVFERYRTPIDMITTSEVAVSLTIDDATHLDEIVTELENIGEVQVDTGLSIICVAGDLAENKSGITGAVFDRIKNIPVRMISYGGSRFNLSFLVQEKYKKTVLRQLNDKLFVGDAELTTVH